MKKTTAPPKFKRFFFTVLDPSQEHNINWEIREETYFKAKQVVYQEILKRLEIKIVRGLKD